MKTKSLVVACVLSAAAFSFNAYSQDSAICSDALKTICTDTKVQRDQRTQYIKTLKEEIKNEANKNAAPRIAQMKKEISAFHIIKRYVRSLKITNQETMLAAKKRIGNIESVVTNPENIALLKSNMYQAIDESNNDQTTKANLKSIIGTIVIGNFSDFLERMDLEDNVGAQLFSNHCGSDGMVPNAFATEIKKERYVLICPGYLINLSQTQDSQTKLDSMIQVISHEMGHHIDNGKIGNEIYKPFLICIAENYTDKFNGTKDDQKYCQKNAAEPDLCKVRLTLGHAGEMIADAWSIKAMNVYARKMNFSIAENSAMLTANWAKLCGSKEETDEGIHVSGDFRIGTLMRMDPEVSRELRCDNSQINSKPSCSFDGATNI